MLVQELRDAAAKDRLHHDECVRITDSELRKKANTTNTHTPQTASVCAYGRTCQCACMAVAVVVVAREKYLC